MTVIIHVLDNLLLFKISKPIVKCLDNYYTSAILAMRLRELHLAVRQVFLLSCIVIIDPIN